MKVITHYPTSKNATENLATQVARVHIDAIVHHLNQLPCPTSQKMLLLEALNKKHEV